MTFRTFLTALFFSLFFVPGASAQQINFQLPQSFEIDRETVVTIEVSDNGSPVEVNDFSLSYSPQDGVFDDVVYDCADPSQMDNCRVNNRGVSGVFEAVFDLKRLPLTLSVDADGVQNSVQLKDQQDAAPISAQLVPSAPEVVPVVPDTIVQNVPLDTSTMAPASVQVGPSPSWWIILLPLALMCAVVSYFVVKTTD